jgi:hypothetical protein
MKTQLHDLGDGLRVGRIPLNLISHRRANYKAMGETAMATLRASVEKYGFKTLVVVTPQPDGTYGIVDGHHREKVARERGMKDVPVVVLEGVDPMDADLAMLSFNPPPGDLIPDVYVDFLKELDAKAGREELAVLAGLEPGFLEDIMSALPTVDGLAEEESAQGGDKSRGQAITIMLPRTAEPILKNVQALFPAATLSDSVMKALTRAVLKEAEDADADHAGDGD